MTTIKTVLKNAGEALGLATDTPLLDAEILLAMVLKKSRADLHAWPERTLTEEEIKNFHGLLARRTAREPLAYLTGSQSFWLHEFTVSGATLVPRPETEMLVEVALTLFEHQAIVRLADLGTGCGAIALSIAAMRPKWEMIATDLSNEAISVAKENCRMLGLENVDFYVGDWCQALPPLPFDLLISNPPYIALSEWAAYQSALSAEPREALISGSDGLDAIRRIVQTAVKYLKKSGYLLVEHGYQQGQAVRHLFEQAGFYEVRTLTDLAGKERVTLGKQFAS